MGKAYRDIQEFGEQQLKLSLMQNGTAADFQTLAKVDEIGGLDLILIGIVQSPITKN